jgi:hypothetical protein
VGRKLCHEEETMHAVLITYECDVGVADPPAPFAALTDVQQGVGGLVLKLRIHDGKTLGSFHLFADRAGADAYLEGGLFARVVANPAFRDFRINHFGVLDELGAHTGVPVLGASTSPA